MTKRSRPDDKENIIYERTNKRRKIYESDIDDSQKIWKKMSKYNKTEDIKKIKPEEEWVSGTAIRNYMLNDPIIDWLDKYYFELGLNDGTIITEEMKNNMKNIATEERNKMQILFTNGLLFEKAVFKELKSKYPKDCIQIGYEHDDVTFENYKKTIET